MERLLGRAFVSVALIGLIVAGGLFVLGLVIESIVSLERRTSLVTHSYDVIDCTDQVLGSIGQAEASQRGFVLTGKNAYLDHYNQAVQDATRYTHLLKDLVSDSTRQQEPRARDLQVLVDGRLASLDKGVQIRKSQGIEVARKYIELGNGLALMDRVRSKADQVKRWEDHLLYGRLQEEEKTRAQLTQAVIGSITVLALLVLVASLSASELHQSRRRLADLIGSVGDPFYALDKRWRFTHFNVAAEQFFGVAGSTAIGKRFLDVFPLAAGSEIEVTYHRAHETGRPQSLETVFPSLDKDVEIRCFPSREGLSVFCHDISERAEHERQIQELNEVLERRVLDRTAQLETFCYSVAHDMRMHVRGISVNATMMAEELDHGRTEEIREKLGRLSTASRQMSRLVEDLLKFARTTTQEVRVTKVDLSKIAAEVVDGLRLEGSCSSDAEFAISPSMTAVADPQLAGVVLQNLMENACKYCRPGVISRVEVGMTGLAFYVRDNGIGFDQRYAERVFLPFERLHSDGNIPGSGIGLANVKRIVERHAGEIWAESELGVGTTFFFTFGGASRSLA